MPLDVLIVGGGIGGAVLANLLGRAGRSCLVLEKSTGPGPPGGGVRPEVLWPATVDVLRKLLPFDPLDETALVPVSGIKFTLDGETALEATPEFLSQAGVRPYSADPARTRELLLQTGLFEVRRGVEVNSVLREDGRVVGVGASDVAAGTGAEAGAGPGAADVEVEEIRADWIVGDDGVHSLVRQACEIPLATRLFPLDFLCFAFDWPPSLPPDVVRVSFARGGRGRRAAVAAFPLPAGRGVGVLYARHATLDRPDRLDAGLGALRDSDPGVAQILGDRRAPDDFAHVRRPWGHAPHYGAPGAFVLGDAAHPVSPAGGQGANMSVADAVALADVMLDEAEMDPVGAYERRRREPNRRSMRFTRLAAPVLSLPAFLTAPLLPLALGALARKPDRFARILRTASTAFTEREGALPFVADPGAASEVE